MPSMQSQASKLMRNCEITISVATDHYSSSATKPFPPVLIAHEGDCNVLATGSTSAGPPSMSALDLLQ